MQHYSQFQWGGWAGQIQRLYLWRPAGAMGFPALWGMIMQIRLFDKPIPCNRCPYRGSPQHHSLSWSTNVRTLLLSPWGQGHHEWRARKDSGIWGHGQMCKWGPGALRTRGTHHLWGQYMRLAQWGKESSAQVYESSMNPGTFNRVAYHSENGLRQP